MKSENFEVPTLEMALADFPRDGCLLIGELSVRTKVEAKTIRFYERIQLITPRKLGRVSLFSVDDLRSLMSIRMLRSLSLSIDQIRLVKKFQGDLAFHNAPVLEVQMIVGERLSVLLSEKARLESQITLIERFISASSPLNNQHSLSSSSNAA